MKKLTLIPFALALITILIAFLATRVDFLMYVSPAMMSLATIAMIIGGIIGLAILPE